MKPVSLGLISLLLAAAGLGFPGCGGDEPPDPETVLQATLSPENLTAGPGSAAGITVESLGFEDRVLDSRQVPVNSRTYAAIRSGLAAGESGFSPLFGDLESEGTAEVGGVETDQVSGTIDVEGLVRTLSRLSRSGAGTDGSSIPGLADLEGLEESLVGADFDLYSGTGDRRLKRLDLTLSLDDPDNALPPTRVRFSLTDNQTNGAQQ